MTPPDRPNTMRHRALGYADRPLELSMHGKFSHFRVQQWIWHPAADDASRCANPMAGGRRLPSVVVASNAPLAPLGQHLPDQTGAACEILDSLFHAIVP